MTYSEGGVLPGGSATMVLVPEPRPDGGGEDFHTVYADECFIRADRSCSRIDEWHTAVPITHPEHRDFAWLCPTHDYRQHWRP